MIEGQRVAAFVWAALSQDVGPGGVSTLLGGRIYRDVVPQAAALPAATVTLVSATDSSSLGGRRIFDVALIDVRVVTSGPSYAAINPIADRVDAVLQNRSGANGGATIVMLRRDQTQAYIETEAGASYAHVIQTVRSEVFETP